MVSHHAPPYAPSEPPISAPRASSVISGRSATRRHRHARTHFGGSSSHLPQNEFPVFSHTGDVEIVVRKASGRKEMKYVLHRLILSQCSGFFEAGTRAEWGGRAIDEGPGSVGGSLARISEVESMTAGSSSRMSSQERRPSYEQNGRRWNYELDWASAGDDDVPMLVQKDGTSQSIFGDYAGHPPPVRNKPPASSENFFRSVTNFTSLSLNDRPSPSGPPEPGDEILKDYDNLFRTMYNHPPNLDTINIATAYTECKALLHLADMYDALEIVGSRVDHHLLRFGVRLFKQIAKYPPSYLKLGYLARSKTIFTEAMIHVVGQWPLAAPQLRGQVETSVMEIIEDKVDELKEIEEKVESKLWRLNLSTSRGERVTPTNDFLSWLAISLFRQWLAENTTLAPTGILKDNGARPASNTISQQSTQQPPPPPPPINTGRIYRLIGSSDPSAYLNRDELKRFLKSPGSQLGIDLYNRDNLKRFERRVDEVKNLARDVVKPLMRNFLELDLRDFGPTGLGYLTCTRIEARDLPWEEI
ncbi:uncharacterized protein MYCGRDRAFT_98251 [Zymoseptoria tritici IPO323]|uniref:BTB domain-containing protein n=1 Tax=Zymoseptoria tritici (strain CBS 115943 / IPO323) TaxID=336722 RepID=F9WXP6_ZYMTI|nr:uncharacterized protein MYCGRDRAFT_98251 [Zymoseptoria tritici IPO323]EGP90988.1 hypothetical protein MYCGRDRAFT_98251 [Zymoseptoria tritici IPO323]